MTDAVGNDPEDLARALSEFTSPIQAMNTVKDRTGGVSLSDFADQLESQIEAQDRWAETLRTIALRGREDVARKLAAAGRRGSVLATLMANASDGEFNRAADLFIGSTQPEE